MDIYKFVVSNSIRNYLKRINYKFSTQEAAFLVWYCETANLNKTLNASIEQIAAIKKLQKTGEFNKLNDNLKEIAKLRLENPDMSLTDLGKILKEPIGKSGVNYRLKKIIELAK